MLCCFVYFGTQHNYTIHKPLIFSNVPAHSICVMISTTWSQFTCSTIPIHIPFATELPWHHIYYWMWFSQHALFTIITMITIHTIGICVIIIIMNVVHRINQIDHTDDAFYSNLPTDCDHFIDIDSNRTPYTLHWITSIAFESPPSQAYPFPTQHCVIDEDRVSWPL